MPKELNSKCHPGERRGPLAAPLAAAFDCEHRRCRHAQSRLPREPMDPGFRRGDVWGFAQHSSHRKHPLHRTLSPKFSPSLRGAKRRSNPETTNTELAASGLLRSTPKKLIPAAHSAPILPGPPSGRDVPEHPLQEGGWRRHRWKGSAFRHATAARGAYSDATDPDKETPPDIAPRPSLSENLLRQARLRVPIRARARSPAAHQRTHQALQPAPASSANGNAPAASRKACPAGYGSANR